jgi:hypothetical protein
VCVIIFHSVLEFVMRRSLKLFKVTLTYLLHGAESFLRS